MSTTGYCPPNLFIGMQAGQNFYTCKGVFSNMTVVCQSTTVMSPGWERLDAAETIQVLVCPTFYAPNRLFQTLCLKPCVSNLVSQSL